MLGILYFASFKSYDYFSEENACQIAKFNWVSKINQRSNQNFQTPSFRKRCQEDITMSIASSLSVGFEKVMFLRNVSLFL